MANMASGPSRRASNPNSSSMLNDLIPGPITRPIAPIARPTEAGNPGSGSGSPNRRSPSPKGFLGSSALAADDDEVVPVHSSGRRAGSVSVGQGWGGHGVHGQGGMGIGTIGGIGIGVGAPPRSAGPVGAVGSPWGAPASAGFGVPPISTSRLPAPSQTPLSAGGLWGNTAPVDVGINGHSGNGTHVNEPWHPRGAGGTSHAPAFYPGSPFLNGPTGHGQASATGATNGGSTATGS